MLLFDAQQAIINDKHYKVRDVWQTGSWQTMAFHFTAGSRIITTSACSMSFWFGSKMTYLLPAAVEGFWGWESISDKSVCVNKVMTGLLQSVYDPACLYLIPHGPEVWLLCTCCLAVYETAATEYLPPPRCLRRDGIFCIRCLTCRCLQTTSSTIRSCCTASLHAIWKRWG
jgi:hypothetical protein